MERLARLFGSPARLKTLRLFIFNGEAAFTLDEVARRTKLPKEMVRREVSGLLGAGFLRKKGERATTRYQIDARFEHLAALTDFVRETTSMESQKIVGFLKRAGTLRLIALSGHFTGTPDPQIDLLIVGDGLNERLLSHAVHSLEAELGREIRYASFPTADFRYRLAVYDRLVRDVFDYPHRLLIDKIGL